MSQNFTAYHRKAATPLFTLQTYWNSVWTCFYFCVPGHMLWTAFQVRACVMCTCFYWPAFEQPIWDTIPTIVDASSGRVDLCFAQQANMTRNSMEIFVRLLEPNVSQTTSDGKEHVTLEPRFVVKTCRCRCCVLASALHSWQPSFCSQHINWRTRCGETSGFSHITW